ncbi:MAG: YceH family protein [Chitinispirillaceae bacterium]
MDYELSPVEQRVVGALMEKEMTTPEYYPLTLNALVSACNQKSNRDPVMNLSQREVENVLENLKDRHFVWQMNLSGSRVPKYEHNLRSLFPLSEQEGAVLCVLLLRGPQTPGELRGRTERMTRFSSLDEVESVLKALLEREDPLVVELSRRPGQKEKRFAHLFSEPPEQDIESPSAVQAQSSEGGTGRLSDRVNALEEELESVKQELRDLKTQFADFRKQFE